jgi:hypothetical protein
LKQFATPGELTETQGDEDMNETNALNVVLLRQFFDRFRDIVYHGVPICKFIHIDLITNWREALIQKNPAWLEEMRHVADLQVYEWSDAPYPYEAHPDGVVVMRGGFGDIAVEFLPRERFFLVSPNQAEVDLIKRNRPDLTAHNIADYYRDNPGAIAALNQRITKAIRGQSDDPLFGSLDFLNWFTGRIPQIVRILDAVQLLFETLNVGAVLTISSVYSMDGALNLIARANRIPSLTLQHGLMAENDLFYHIPVLATQKMVWGEANRQWYQKFGFPESRVSVIGSPRFDTIFNQKWCGKEQLCRKLGTDPAKKIVVFAAPVIRFNQMVAPLVFDGLRSIPEVFLVMLLHPGEDPSLYEPFTPGFANCQILRFGQIRLYDALSGADCFITYASTSTLEAMFFKLPIITAEPVPPTFSFGELGASIRVTNSAELNQAVRRLFSDELFRRDAIERYHPFLLEYCIPDGSAGKRLFERVETFCRTGGIA